MQWKVEYDTGPDPIYCTVLAAVQSTVARLILEDDAEKITITKEY